MIKEKWPYILLILLLIGGGFLYTHCQKPKSNMTLGDEILSKETIPAKNPDNEEKTKLEEQKVEDIVIDIKGAVKNPGVYHMTMGDRVADVLKKAGGWADEADKGKVNLAKKLFDEMMIYVPKKGEKITENDMLSNSGALNGSERNGKININTASEKELEQITGIGPSKAAAIIEYREKNGLFQKIEDLDNVSGFGEKTIERMRDQIIVQ